MTDIIAGMPVEQKVQFDHLVWIQVVGAYRTVYPQLYRLAVAIQRHEGWEPSSGAGKGSRSWRHKNPGNLRSSPFDHGTKDGFSLFMNDHEGMSALLWDLQAKCSGRTSTGLGPRSTLVDLFRVYAPSDDDNDPDAYAEAVATELGVSPGLRLERLLEPF